MIQFLMCLKVGLGGHAQLHEGETVIIPLGDAVEVV